MWHTRRCPRPSSARVVWLLSWVPLYETEISHPIQSDLHSAPFFCIQHQCSPESRGITRAGSCIRHDLVQEASLSISSKPHSCQFCASQNKHSQEPGNLPTRIPSPWKSIKSPWNLEFPSPSTSNKYVTSLLPARAGKCKMHALDCDLSRSSGNAPWAFWSCMLILTAVLFGIRFLHLL